MFLRSITTSGFIVRRQIVKADVHVDEKTGCNEKMNFSVIFDKDRIDKWVFISRSNGL